MKGDPKVIEHLNKALKLELTTVNQYFLHARMFRDWGFAKIAKIAKNQERLSSRTESFIRDEMSHESPPESFLIRVPPKRLSSAVGE